MGLRVVDCERQGYRFDSRVLWRDRYTTIDRQGSQPPKGQPKATPECRKDAEAVTCNKACWICLVLCALHVPLTIMLCSPELNYLYIMLSSSCTAAPHALYLTASHAAQMPHPSIHAKPLYVWQHCTSHGYQYLGYLQSGSCAAALQTSIYL